VKIKAGKTRIARVEGGREKRRKSKKVKIKEAEERKKIKPKSKKIMEVKKVVEE